MKPTKPKQTNKPYDILTGQFGHIARVVAFNTVEGWSRDVTEDIAREVSEQARRQGLEIRGGARELVERFADAIAARWAS